MGEQAALLDDVADRAAQRLRPLAAHVGAAHQDLAGGRFLNMIHRDDAVGAIMRALERGQAGEIYNVTDDQPVTEREFFQWLAAQLGRELPPSAPVRRRCRNASHWIALSVRSRSLA